MAVKFEIQENVGIVSEGKNGWMKEVNIVGWNGAAPKFDIRSWDEDHEHMSRGITLTEEEMNNLCEAYKSYKKHKGGNENV